jgi:hypothetical protein
MRATSKFISLFLLALCFCKVDAFENYCGDAVRFESFNESGSPLVRHIITNGGGVFLQVGNSWIATEGLQVSGEKMFVLVNGEWITIAEALENPECVRATWKCEVCGFINYDGISACGVCGTPRPKKRG